MKAVMKDVLKILILEDVSTDADLVERELNRKHFIFTSKRVDSEDTYCAALQEFKPDIILSDYMLPQFTGMEALLLAKAIAPRTPFIVVTGSINEETAVDCIKAGAWDYVTKEHLPRLGPAIKSALERKNIRHEKEKAEDNLRLSEEKFSKALRSSPTFIAITTLKEGLFIDINDSFLLATGYSREEVVGHTASELGIWPGDDDYNKTFGQLLLNESVHNREVKCRTKSGDVLTVLWSAEKISIEDRPCIISVILDITERKKLESQLLHSQKMEAVGQLAGGVAHDFNNILSAIVNYVYLLQSKTKEDETLKGDLDQITALSLKAADITRGLLAFSRKHFINPIPMGLNDSVRNMEKLLSKFIGEDIQVDIKLSDKEPVIMADSAQIEQIIINLATNSRDAMPDGGILTIETGLIELSSDFISSRGFGKPGTYALLSISDSGTGMDEETKQKIFEPFFTTKEPGKGTGLGLSIIYGIVKQHDGYITADSEPGKGTTFKIYFHTADMRVEKKEETKPSDLRGNAETILVVEDEAEVRQSEKRILEKYGYNVIEAVDGEDALEKFRENKDKISLLLVDVVMPKKNGRETYEEIKKMNPEMKAIFTSGYSVENMSRKGMLADNCQYIVKPVMPDVLLKNIKKALHGE